MASSHTASRGDRRARPTYIIRMLILMSVFLAAAVSRHGDVVEAKALLQKAISHYQKAGRKQAVADFNSDKAKWTYRDLYVYCVDRNDMILANAGFPSLIGLSADSVKTDDGKPRGKAAWAAVAATGEGTTQFSGSIPSPENTSRRRATSAKWVPTSAASACTAGSDVGPATSF